MSGSRGETPRFLVGIDGGATRTRYLLADESGNKLGRSEGRGSLIGAGEDDAIVAALAAEVRALVERAGGALPVAGLCAGLAGAAGRSHAARATAQQLLDLGVARRATVVPDPEVAFVDAFGDGAGILLIGGTGSIGLARAGTAADGAGIVAAAPGEFVRVGGWGLLLGDEGSGYWIGLEGLRAAVRGREGRSPATTLGDVVFAALAVESVDELLEWTREADKARVAALAPHIVAAADAGDQVAAGIVAEAVRFLVHHATALRSAVGAGAGTTVALVGGLVEPGGRLHARVAAALALEGMSPLGRVVDGARGAVRMAGALR